METAWMCRTSYQICLPTVSSTVWPYIEGVDRTGICISSLLESKESVVLYVAHNNPAAAKVYHRVGFVGLCDEERSTDSVDNWLELGFDRGLVDLGHW